MGCPLFSGVACEGLINGLRSLMLDEVGVHAARGNRLEVSSGSTNAIMVLG